MDYEESQRMTPDLDEDRDNRCSNALPCDVLRCKAECCGVVPIPRAIFERNKHKLQREVQTITDAFPGQVIALAENATCGFLTLDHKCAIYEERPSVCRKFGSVNETHEMLICPHKKEWAKSKERP